MSSQMEVVLLRFSYVRRFFAALLVALIFTTQVSPLGSFAVYAAVGVPNTISYQGRLKSSTGEAVSGTYDFIFEFYDAASGGVLLATETHDDVTVTDGYFSVNLDLDGDVADFANIAYLDIQVKADADVSYDTMSSRVAINATPYSLFTRGIENSSTAPASNLFAGRMYFNTGDGLLYVYNGVSWTALAASGGGDNLDVSYNNFGALPSKINVDAAEGQTGGLEFESTISSNIIIDLQSTGDFVIQDAGSTYATFSDAGAIVFTGGTTANTFASSGATITGGSVNSTPIGNSSASSGAFTTLSSTGVTTIGNNSATVAVNSSDWDIDATGAITGVSFDANGSGNSLSNVDNADLSNDTIDFDKMIDSGTLDSAWSVTGSAGRTITLARTLTDATSETGVLINSTASDSSSGTTAQYGLYLDNLASTEGLDASLVIDNSDADDVVGAAIKIVNAGGGFTTLVDNAGTLISGAEFNILDGGITNNELTDTGTLTVTTVDINGGAIDGTAIGASSPSTGAFTTLSSTGVTTLGNNSATVAINSSDWDINATGDATGIGGITMDGNFSQTGSTTFATGSGTVSLNGSTTANTFASSGATITGGSVNSTPIGNSSASTGAFTTLASTGVTTIGNNSATVAVNSSDWDIDATGAITGVSFDANGTGNSLSNVEDGDLANDTIDFDKMIDAGTLDAAWSVTGAAGKTITFARTFTDATTENGVLINSTASDSSSGTTNQYGLYLDNLASTEGLDASLVIDNSDTDDVVGAAIKIVNAGGGFTSVIDNAGTLISGTELNVLDGGILLSELTDTGTFTATTVDINGGAIDGTTIGASSASSGAFTTLSSTGVTTLGNNSATVAINSSDWDINATGDATGIGGLAMDGAFSQSGATTFSTGTSTVSLNGATTVANGSTFTANGIVALGDNGDTVTINSSDWDIDATGAMTGIGAITSDGLITTSDDLAVNGGDFTSTSGTFNFLDAASNSATIEIGGVTTDIGNTVRIATNATTADTITIGNTTATTALTLNSGTWNIASTGVQTMTATSAQLTAFVITDTDYTNALSIDDNNIVGTTFSLTGTTAQIDFTNFDVASSGAITVAAGVGLDTNGAGALALGNTNATSVSLCNSAACDTVSLATNADADAINIGDSLDTTTLAGSVTANTFASSGATISGGSINSTPIGNSSASTGAFTTLASTGVTTLGNNSATVAVNSSDWDIDATGIMTGIGAITSDGLITTSDDLAVNGGDFTSTSGTFNFLDATSNSTTIEIGGVTTDLGNTVRIATNATTADVITIGNTTATTTLALNSGTWNMASTGVLSMTATASQTTAIDVTDTDYTNALSIGDNNITGTTFSLTGTTAAIDFTNFDVGTNGVITVAAGTGLDTNAAGALALGNTNATSVSLCNSAACDTVSIGTNTDADTITIGDSTDTTSLIGGAAAVITFTDFSVASTGATTITPDSNVAGLTVTGTNVTSANLLSLDARNTTGTLANIAYGGAVTQGGGALTGLALDLNTNLTTPAAGRSVTGISLSLPTVSTTSLATNYSGYALTTSGAITNGTAGSLTWNGTNVTIPNLTQSAGGSVTANGALITTGTITTAGIQNAINVTAAGVGAGTLNGLNVSGITAGAGTEIAITTGDGWDTGVSIGDETKEISFTSTSPTITVANGGTIVFTDNTNTLFSIVDGGSAGTIQVTGGISVGSGNIATVSNANITLSPNGSGDVILPSDNNTNVQMASSSAPTADMIAVTNTGQSSATTGVDALSLTFDSSNASGDIIHLTPAYAGGATDTLTYNAFEADAFSPTNSAGTDTVNGILLGALTDPGATITSSGIKIGGGWDNAISGTTAGTNVISFTNFVVTTAGVVTAQLNTATGANGPFALCHENNGNQNEAIKDCNGVPLADYAERYPLASGITYGDIVVPGTKVVYQEDPFNGRQAIVQGVKSTTPYQGPVIGIVSNNYGDFSSAGNNLKDEDNPVPVALVGRVPVNVTNENGPIAVGDFITTSSTPGKGMKATEAGRVIGMALGSFTGTAGQVMVQVLNTWYQPPVAAASPLQGGNNTGAMLASGAVRADSLVVSGTSRFEGSVTIKERLYAGADVAGRARIKAGDDYVTVTFPHSYMTTPIVNATLRTGGEMLASWWVGEENEDSFTLHLDRTLLSDVEFNWTALGTDEGVVTISDGTTEEITSTMPTEDVPEAPPSVDSSSDTVPPQTEDAAPIDGIPAADSTTPLDESPAEPTGEVAGDSTAVATDSATDSTAATPTSTETGTMDTAPTP